jgi:hypothetical protein
MKRRKNSAKRLFNLFTPLSLALALAPLPFLPGNAAAHGASVDLDACTGRRPPSAECSHLSERHL